MSIQKERTPTKSKKDVPKKKAEKGHVDFQRLHEPLRTFEGTDLRDLQGAGGTDPSPGNHPPKKSPPPQKKSPQNKSPPLKTNPYKQIPPLPLREVSAKQRGDFALETSEELQHVVAGHASALTRSSSGEVRIRVPTFFRKSILVCSLFDFLAF